MAWSKHILKILKYLGVAAFWVLIWKGASLLAGDGLELFLPPPEKVLSKWWEMIRNAEFLRAVWATLLRIFEGFLWGVLSGVVLGLFTTRFRVIYELLSPIMKIIRAVPVVTFIILVFVFFHVNRIPVFICFLMVMPLVWQSVHDGIEDTDPRLLEMSRVFGINNLKTMLFIRLPAALPALITTCVSALGLAWKSGVAAEVISSPDLSLGYQITRSKSNLDYDELFAVTLTVVLLSLIFEVLFKWACRRLLKGRGQEI